jgi:hypothetical protein
MDAAEAPLCWPGHYPPTDRWKRFFLGVRWLGPDLSFFRDLKELQGQRSPQTINLWGADPERRKAAEVFGRAFQRNLRWPTPHFLPGDEFRAVAAGPRFELVEHFELEAAVEDAERMLHGRAPDEYWHDAFDRTLGEVVDEYLKLTRP